MKDGVYNFEALVIDPTGTSEIKSEQQLIFGLLYSNKFLISPKNISTEAKWAIEDLSQKISIRIKSVDTSEVLMGVWESSFLINVESNDFEEIEAFRNKMLLYLKSNLKFKHIRVLTDDVSTASAQMLYPEINKVENLLRRYLTKFFLLRVGLNWWEATATQTMVDKVKMRKNERKEKFFEFIDSDVSFSDFDDLGELVYKQSSGFNNPDKVINKIILIKNEEDLKNLQSELQGNYSKYFKEFFQEKHFEALWKELVKIRNKVAHNGTIFKQELDRGFELTKAVTEIIISAENQINEVVFSVEEKESIRNATIEAEISSQIDIEENENSANWKHSNEEQRDISEAKKDTVRSKYIAIHEDELIAELLTCEKSPANQYVGLKWFVTEYLAMQGYSIGLSFSLINIMADKGKIEIYDIPMNEYTIKAIKLKNVNQVMD